MTGRYSAKKTNKSHGFAANLSRISIDFISGCGVLGCGCGGAVM
jgi:hypothetical protein